MAAAAVEPEAAGWVEEEHQDIPFDSGMIWPHSASSDHGSNVYLTNYVSSPKSLRGDKAAMRLQG